LTQKKKSDNHHTKAYVPEVKTGLFHGDIVLHNSSWWFCGVSTKWKGIYHDV